MPLILTSVSPSHSVGGFLAAEVETLNSVKQTTLKTYTGDQNRFMGTPWDETNGPCENDLARSHQRASIGCNRASDQGLTGVYGSYVRSPMSRCTSRAYKDCQPQPS